MPNIKLVCCHVCPEFHLACGRPADWEIYDERDRRPDAPSCTHSCTEHISGLIGDSESLTPDMLSRPQVFRLVRVEQPGKMEEK